MNKLELVKSILSDESSSDFKIGGSKKDLGKPFSMKDAKLLLGKPRKCHGKVAYDKKTALTAKNRRYKQDHVELRIYPCPDCNMWHLTSLI